MGRASQARIYCSEKVYSRSTDSKAPDEQGLGCEPGCTANSDLGLTLLKPSPSHSPSCAFCPLFWHSIHHSSLVPSNLLAQP